jgi:CxxC-x17-CxxC domain-containing protein
MADRTLTCRDCGNSFVFTEGEQDFYQSRGFSEPVRCPSCRAQKKANRGEGYGTEGYGGGGYGGGGYGGGSGGRKDRPMTTVTCSNCGRETQVPFVPTGDRPVYCSDCFALMGGGSRSSRG